MSYVCNDCILTVWSLHLPQRRALRLIFPAAPAFTAIEYHDAEWQNDFDEQDEYRGTPTPGRDQAWLNLWSSKIHRKLRGIMTLTSFGSG